MCTFRHFLWLKHNHLCYKALKNEYYILSQNHILHDNRLYTSCVKYTDEIIPSWMIICDTIKGNESLVENFNFLTPLFHNFQMLHFDANPITIGYLVTEL